MYKDSIQATVYHCETDTPLEATLEIVATEPDMSDFEVTGLELQLCSSAVMEEIAYHTGETLQATYEDGHEATISDLEDFWYCDDAIKGELGG